MSGGVSVISNIVGGVLVNRRVVNAASTAASLTVKSVN